MALAFLLSLLLLALPVRAVAGEIVGYPSTITSPTLSSPTITGTVSGTPTVASAWTWSAAQTFPGLTLSGNLAMGGNAITGTGAITPNVNDGGALGSATLSYSDLFLASGGVINWNNGNVVLTHTANTLTATGTGLGSFVWGDVTIANSGNITQNNNGVLTSGNGGVVVGADSGAPLVLRGGGNGQNAAIRQTTESHTLAAAATSDTTITAPANSLVIGVTIRVTTTITGCTTLDVGVAGATTRYGTGIALTSGTTNVSPGTTNPTIYGAATAIRFTAVGGGASFTAGVIRVTVHYIDLTAPTS